MNGLSNFCLYKTLNFSHQIQLVLFLLEKSISCTINFSNDSHFYSRSGHFPRVTMCDFNVIFISLLILFHYYFYRISLKLIDLISSSLLGANFGQHSPLDHSMCSDDKHVQRKSN